MEHGQRPVRRKIMLKLELAAYTLPISLVSTIIAISKLYIDTSRLNSMERLNMKFEVNFCAEVNDLEDDLALGLKYGISAYKNAQPARYNSIYHLAVGKRMFSKCSRVYTYSSLIDRTIEIIMSKHDASLCYPCKRNVSVKRIDLCVQAVFKPRITLVV